MLARSWNHAESRRHVNHVSLSICRQVSLRLLFFVANSPRIASRRALEPHLYSVGVIGRIRGALSRSWQMRCFKKKKRSRRGRAPEVVARAARWIRRREGRRSQERRDLAYISYAGGGCFAWPRQYYYHIFRIMRSRVCLLFHAIPLSLRQEGWREVWCILTFYHSLFVSCSFLHYICNIPMKSLYAIATRSIEVCPLTLQSICPGQGESLIRY